MYINKYINKNKFIKCIKYVYYNDYHQAFLGETLGFHTHPPVFERFLGMIPVFLIMLLATTSKAKVEILLDLLDMLDLT